MKKEATVFIVEDDIALADAVCWLMKTYHISCRAFNSAEAFLEAYDKNWSGCVLVDIRMPGMSGLCLQEQLEQQQNLLPFIFFTGDGDAAIIIQALKAGAFDFVLKPFNDEIMFEKIQKAIQLNQQWRENPALKQEHIKRCKSSNMPEEKIMQFIAESKLN